MVKNTCLTLAVLCCLACTGAAAEEGVAVSTTARRSRPDTAAKNMFSVKGKSITELLPKLDDKKTAKAAKTIRMYKGATDGRQSYSLTMAPEAHWRVLWKIDILDKKDSAAIKLNVRSLRDKTYVQGLQKEIIKDEESAFGVINVCFEGGGDFTLDLETVGAKWDVQVQQLQ